MCIHKRKQFRGALVLAGLVLPAAWAQSIETVEVEGQPLAANIKRLVEAFEYLGSPFPVDTAVGLKAAANDRDAKKLQQLLDPQVLLVVSLNPESRVKVARGPARATLQQAGFTPVLIKVINDSTVTETLRIKSPQSGPGYAGVAALSMSRQDQLQLKENENTHGDRDRFLAVEMFSSQPMTARLSGLKVEYAIGLIYSNEAGQREATLSFDVGQGSQDLGFRSEIPVLFNVRPAIPVMLSIKDYDGRPSCGRFTFRDKTGHTYPPQAKRLAPEPA